MLDVAAKTVCGECGTSLTVQPYSYTDPVPQAREIVRQMLQGQRQDDGSVLAIADANGELSCPQCHAEIGVYESTGQLHLSGVDTPPVEGIPAPGSGAVSSWDELRSALKAEFDVEVDEPGGMGLRFEVAGSRTQSVALKEVHIAGRSWVEIATGIVAETEVDPLAALRLAGRLDIGGLIGQDGLIVYRQALPLADLDQEAFRQAFAHVVNVGDELEQALGAAHDDRF